MTEQHRIADNQISLPSTTTPKNGESPVLQELLHAAYRAGWAGAEAEELAHAIEERIVAKLPSPVRQALGADEARQRARVLAWERCRVLVVDPPLRGLTWGYLANYVRWRLADAMRAEMLRHDRHPAFDIVPDRIQQPAELALDVDLGPRLERLADELCLAGLDSAAVYRLLRAATEGPRFERARIVARLLAAGATERQADALAWLLRGGAGFESVISRLARGEDARQVFEEAGVRRQVIRAATMTAAASRRASMPWYGAVERSKRTDQQVDQQVEQHTESQTGPHTGPHTGPQTEQGQRFGHSLRASSVAFGCQAA